jgi:hypothetical protein
VEVVGIEFLGRRNIFEEAAGGGSLCRRGYSLTNSTFPYKQLQKDTHHSLLDLFLILLEERVR